MSVHFLKQKMEKQRTSFGLVEYLLIFRGKGLEAFDPSC
jgi:hypothetical protein